MHDDSDDPQQPNSLRQRKPFDAAPHLPPEGRWKLLHGDVAFALVKLSRDIGQMVADGPGLELPAGFPRPVSVGVWWRMKLDGRSVLLREDQSGNFLSCYLYGEPAAA